MNITIAGITFDHVHYDQDGDVLYLNVGTPGNAVDYDDTPEGHNVGWNAAGEIVSIALLHPRWELETHGKVEITLPHHVDLDAAALNQALIAA